MVRKLCSTLLMMFILVLVSQSPAFARTVRPGDSCFGGGCPPPHLTPIHRHAPGLQDHIWKGFYR